MRLFKKLQGLTGWLRDVAGRPLQPSSIAPSAPPVVGLGGGPRLTEAFEEEVENIVHLARYETLTVQSDWARRRSRALAAAAVLGLITTETPEGFGRVWRVTAKGIQWLDGEVDL